MGMGNSHGRRSESTHDSCEFPLWRTNSRLYRDTARVTAGAVRVSEL